MSSIQEDEFEGKSFRQCAEIIVFDRNDAMFSQRQIDALVEQHNKRLEAVLALPELKYEITGTNGEDKAIRNGLRTEIRAAIERMK